MLNLHKFCILIKLSKLNTSNFVNGCLLVLSLKQKQPKVQQIFYNKNSVEIWCNNKIVFSVLSTDYFNKRDQTACKLAMCKLWQVKPTSNSNRWLARFLALAYAWKIVTSIYCHLKRTISGVFRSCSKDAGKTS